MEGVIGGFGLSARIWPVPGDLAAYYPATYCAFEAGAARAPRMKTVVLRQVWKAAFHHRTQVRRTARAVLKRNSAAREIARYAPGPSFSLLDVGCGGGRFLEGARRLGVDGEGIEPSVQAQRVALHRGVPCRQDNFDTASIEAESYQVVRFAHVLEHVPSPRATVRKAFEALAPGGVIVIQCPNWGGVLARVFQRDWYPLDAPRHLWHFNQRSLTRLLTDAGFDMESVSMESWGGHLRKSFDYALRSHAGKNAGPEVPGEGFAAVAAFLDSIGQGDAMTVVARKAAM